MTLLSNLYPGVSKPLENAKARLISNGAGLQSMAMIYAADRGLIGPMPDAAIWGNTGNARTAETDNIRFLRSSNTKPQMPIIEVQGGDLTQDLDDATAGRIKRFPNPPFFVKNPDGSRGILNRSCTRDYKITPVRREAKRLIGHKPGARLPKEPVVEVWIGITTDEAHRMDLSQEAWVQHRFPLVEIGWSRHDCDTFLFDLFGIHFGHSGCIDCPFRSPEEWFDMMQNDPDDYERACQDDEKIRHGLPNVKLPAFMHDGLTPLRTTDWRAEIERRRGTLLGWGNACGSGACGL